MIHAKTHDNKASSVSNLQKKGHSLCIAQFQPLKRKLIINFYSKIIISLKRKPIIRKEGKNLM